MEKERERRREWRCRGEYWIIMWPFDKYKKGITIAPGERLNISILSSWRRDKDEVIIMTDHGPVVLNGKDELFIEIKGDNIDPVKLQIVPDFKNRVLNFVEIIDPNAKRKFADQNGPKLVFDRSTIIEKNMSFGDHLKALNSGVEDLGKIAKRLRWFRNIAVPIEIMLIFWNLYLFVTGTGTMRYINLFVVIIMGYIIYHIWNSDKKYHKDYERYKVMKDNIFGIVKER